MYTIKKMYKKYGKRKIRVYDGKKAIGEVSVFCHWICLDSHKYYTTLRKIAMENLWWLLHTDQLDEDVTEEEAWEEKMKRFNSGRFLSNEVDSLFFPGEYEIALNSINNR